MAARKRAPKPSPAPAPKPVKKFVQVIEGLVTVDEEDGIVIWDYIPPNTDRPAGPAHGFATGGILDAFLCGKQVRITIEEL